VEFGALRNGHFLGMKDPVADAISVMVDDVGEVLVQGAAEVNVDHLRAATDTQHGHTGFQGGAEECVLKVVSQILGFRSFGVGFLVVTCWVNVGPARYEETIETPDNPYCLVGGQLLRWEQKG